MKLICYFLDCVTNLHVGDIGDDLSIVDKQVQIDSVTRLPTIFATSLKGALRNHCETSMGKETVNVIFGGEGKTVSQGKFRFLQAQMALYPVPDAESIYRHITSPTVRLMLGETLALAGGALDDWLDPDKAHVKLEYLNIGAPLVHTLDEVSDDEMMKAIDGLPVVARNQLDNGKSETLWYENFVPRLTRFLVPLLVPEGAEDADGKLLSAFEKAICASTGVQIGANATVGYGLCRFTRLAEKPQGGVQHDR